MKKQSIVWFICVSSIVVTPILGKMSLDGVYSLFGKYNHEAVVEKEYQLKQPGTVTINNLAGNISVTAEWKRDTMYVKATKRAAKEEDLEKVGMRVQQKNDESIEIASDFDATVKCALDLELIVPAHAKLQLSADSGLIKVHDVNGAIVAHTINGAIDIKNTTNTITALTEESGNIVIAHAKGNIKATTTKGNITIHDAVQSIIATTSKGNITTACLEVPAASRIALNAEQSGAIKLTLPADVNATLQGKTSKGRLTSDHYVTIKPFTTRLDKHTHKEFEKQVNGILGTGEADISVISNNGNIKIMETKVV